MSGVYTCMYSVCTVADPEFSKGGFQLPRLREKFVWSRPLPVQQSPLITGRTVVMCIIYDQHRFTRTSIVIIIIIDIIIIYNNKINFTEQVSY